MQQHQLGQQLQPDGHHAKAADMRIGQHGAQPRAILCAAPAASAMSPSPSRCSAPVIAPRPPARQRPQPGSTHAPSPARPPPPRPPRRRLRETSGSRRQIRARWRPRRAAAGGHELQGQDQRFHAASPVTCAPSGQMRSEISAA
jgi:hypothetical protein